MHDIYVEVFYGMGREEQMVMAKEIGYTGFFSGPDYAHDLEELKNYRYLADKIGLKYETVHSTIPGCMDIWLPGEKGDEYIDLLLKEIDNCVAVSVPIIVVHVQANRREPIEFELGAMRYAKIVEAAKEKGVKIAFENANHAEYLYRILERFPDEHVGLCYDIGHDIAYTPDSQFLTKIGNRLMCTHLHDNDGVGDLHQLPFDGVIDFEDAAKKLKAAGYNGNLTFELRYNAPYEEKYDKRAYLQECYDRAIKFRDMIEK